jgi:hypothetical protein
MTFSTMKANHRPHVSMLSRLSHLTPFALAALVFILLPSRAEARLGWTMPECEAKYGSASITAPVLKKFKESSVEATFKYEGWRILAAWFPGTDKVQYIRYTSDTPKMSKEQLQAILEKNSEGRKWEKFVQQGDPLGAAVASILSGESMSIGHFVREDGAQTDTIMLAAINNVGIKSAWLNAWLKRNEALEEQKRNRIPNL